MRNFVIANPKPGPLIQIFYCLKYLGLVVGQPLFVAAQDVNNVAATKKLRIKSAIFFMRCI